MKHCLNNFILNKEHHQYRHTVAWDLATEYASNALTPIERMADRFERMCCEEKAVILEGEKIVFLRTVSNLPDIFTDEEWAEIRQKFYIHELGFMSNLSPNYYDTISEGLLAKRESADEYGKFDSPAALPNVCFGLGDFRDGGYV